MGLLDRLRGSREDRFAHQVMAAARAAGIGEVWYDRSRFAIGYRRTPGEEPGWGFLGNVYRESADDSPAERAGRIQRYVAIVFDKDDVPRDWATVRPLLRPVLRGVTFGMFTPTGAVTTLSRPVLPFIDEYVVIDLPTSMAYVLDGQPATWGVPAEEVFAAARENIAALGPAGAGPAAEPAVLRFVDGGDDYVVSRLLLDGWLAALAPEVGGRPVAFVPDNNTLVVSADGPRLAGLFELIEKEYGEAPRSLSPAAYTVDGHGRLVPYPEEGPAGPAARRAAVVLAIEEYGAQAHWLAERYGDRVFVGTLLAMQRSDGSVFTSATWTDGVDTLMPRAEYIGFIRGRDELFHVPWQVVAAEMGLGPVAELLPERFRVSAWPPEPVLSRLRDQAVEL